MKHTELYKHKFEILNTKSYSVNTQIFDLMIFTRIPEGGTNPKFKILMTKTKTTR